MSVDMERITKSIQETEKFAASVVRDISKQKKRNNALVVGLSGELGSGKTAFTKGVARALGVKTTVTSPTFVLEKIYTLSPRKTFSKLVHIDAYRLENKKELDALNWGEIIQDPSALVLIEWPECVKGALPQNAQKISFMVVDDTTRKILWQKKNTKKRKKQ